MSSLQTGPKFSKMLYIRIYALHHLDILVVSGMFRTVYMQGVGKSINVQKHFRINQ